MAGAPNGRSPYPGLFVAYPPARRTWGTTPSMPTPSPSAYFDPSDYEGLIDYPSELPDVDDMVQAYGRGGPWPGEADGPPDETATAVAAEDPSARNDSDPHLDPVATKDIDPDVQAAAEAITDAIKAQPNFDRTEYGATIYRDSQGKIGRTPLTRGDMGKLNGLPTVPAGSTVEGYAHNHPSQTAIAQGKQRGFSPPEFNAYLAGQAGEPSDADMAR